MLGSAIELHAVVLLPGILGTHHGLLPLYGPDSGTRAHRRIEYLYEAALS